MLDVFWFITVCFVVIAIGAVNLYSEHCENIDHDLRM